MPDLIPEQTTATPGHRGSTERSSSRVRPVRGIEARPDGPLALIAPMLDAAYRVACCVSCSPFLAEAIVEETVRRALRPRHAPREAQGTPQWFLGLLIEVCGERMGQPWPALASPSFDTGRHPARSGRVPADEIGLGDILSAMAGLAFEDRVVTALYLVEQLGYADLSAILRRPVERVRARLHRGRRRLQRALGGRVA
jgi:RNA polymerase sigma-70 factor, ECF subfamily